MKRLYVITASVVAGLAIGATAMSAIPGSSGTVKFCYAKMGGAARIVDQAVPCRTTENSVVVNQQGLPGGRGPTGQAGPTGPTGLTGVQNEYEKALCPQYSGGPIYEGECPVGREIYTFWVHQMPEPLYH